VEKAGDEAVSSNFYVEENRLSFQPLRGKGVGVSKVGKEKARISAEAS
jgi:hypothetical protein